jgi:hypothetical protein
MSFTALERRVGNKMVARTAPIEDRSTSARKNKALNKQGIYSFDKDILVGRFANIGKGMSIGFMGGRRGSIGQGGTTSLTEVLLDIRGKSSRGTGVLITNHSSAGDSYITFKRFDTDALALSSSPWTVGIDGGDSDKFKICKGTAVGTNVALTIDDLNLKVGIGTASPSANADLTLEGGVLNLKETTTPTADANYAKIYSKADNRLYWQDGAGTEHTITHS